MTLNNNEPLILPRDIVEYVIATYERKLQAKLERIDSMNYETVPFNKHMEHGNKIALLVADKNEIETSLEICRQYMKLYHP